MSKNEGSNCNCQLIWIIQHYFYNKDVEGSNPPNGKPLPVRRSKWPPRSSQTPDPKTNTPFWQAPLTGACTRDIETRLPDKTRECSIVKWGLLSFVLVCPPGAWEVVPDRQLWVYLKLWTAAHTLLTLPRWQKHTNFLSQIKYGCQHHWRRQILFIAYFLAGYGSR